MANWNDVIELIQNTEHKTDENGFAIPQKEQSRFVFCNKRSVSMTEFNRSQQNGYTVQLKIDMNLVDYDNEMLVKVDGKRYKVMRTYENGNIMELTLSDLSERSVKNGYAIN